MSSFVKSETEMVVDALVTLSKCIAKRGGVVIDHLDAKALAAFDAEHREVIGKMKKSIQKEYVVSGHHVKFIDVRLSSIKNNRDVMNFLDVNRAAPKVVVMKEWTQKVVKMFLEYPNTEVFQLLELQVDVTEHMFQPYFEVVRDKEELKEAHDNIRIGSYPKMQQYDPIARYFALQPSDVIRIRRPSILSGYNIMYREIAPQDIADVFGD